MAAFAATHCRKGHALSGVNVVMRMRRSGLREGHTWAECQICKKDRQEYTTSRKGGLKFRYNMSLEDFDVLWVKQLGLCAICLTTLVRINTKPGQRDAANVDHDKVSGKIRGLLCGNCNIGIGNLRDSINLLNRAIEYLAKSS